MNTKNLLCIGLATLGFAGGASAQESKGKILVVVSSENKLPLKNGGSYSTGYYLNELGVPARRLAEAGYTLVFADPRGNTPARDLRSESASYFEGDEAAFEATREFVDSLDGLRHPLRLADVIRDGLEPYAGVFVPGGHAPMTDLAASPEFGQVLRHFHAAGKPTALICHGPAALASAVADPEAYQKALIAGDEQAARAAAGNWIYSGYAMTVFSTAEEKLAAANLGGEPLYFVETALGLAGGKLQEAKEWQPNAVRDRELITGQNPFSDSKFVDLFLGALSETSPQN